MNDIVISIATVKRELTLVRGGECEPKRIEYSRHLFSSPRRVKVTSSVVIVWKVGVSLNCFQKTPNIVSVLSSVRRTSLPPTRSCLEDCGWVGHPFCQMEVLFLRSLLLVWLGWWFPVQFWHYLGSHPCRGIRELSSPWFYLLWSHQRLYV